MIHSINILIRSCHSPTTLKRHNKAIQEFANTKVKMNEKGANINTSKSEISMDVDQLQEKLDLEKIKDLFKLPKTALGYEKKEYSFDDYKCFSLLRLSDRDNKLPHQWVFWERMILDSYNNKKISDYVQEMCTHVIIGVLMMRYFIVKYSDYLI